MAVNFYFLWERVDLSCYCSILSLTASFSAITFEIVFNLRGTTVFNLNYAFESMLEKDVFLLERKTWWLKLSSLKLIYSILIPFIIKVKILAVLKVSTRSSSLRSIIDLSNSFWHLKLNLWMIINSIKTLAVRNKPNMY